ncbi:hypothetical protein VM98_34530 [Streptomyces rubellomurinus subsp. indigoferus]|nr:hypothetical protein VM98_34530 [Streptomyces rubellomurinus subsp. indigoferus]
MDSLPPVTLTVATPCPGWTLRSLLAHVLGQHRGFAAAALGAGPDLALFADAPVGAAPAGDFRRQQRCLGEDRPAGQVTCFDRSDRSCRDDRSDRDHRSA